MSPTSNTSTQQVVPWQSGWITSSTTLNTAGNYKFVFIGTHTIDRTGLFWEWIKTSERRCSTANPPPQNELRAKVTVQAVESNQVRIGSNLLTSAQTSVLNDPGGHFSILADGADHSKFTIDPNTGNITSNVSLQYDVFRTVMNLLYAMVPGGVQHDETVTLKLTPYDEASSVITAQEANLTLNFRVSKKFIDFEDSADPAVKY